MDCKKKIGTREEVYKLIAARTAGGLCKSDIIEKNFNGKLIYISKKISEKMKAQLNIIRETNPTFFKKQKKTHSVGFVKKNKNKHIAKTQKLSFEIHKNEVKNIYYPELKGIDLKELKEELLREEEEEDLQSIELNKKESKTLEPFKIEELPDIDINFL